MVATGGGAGYYSRDAAMSRSGLVYAVNSRYHGKLVFAPMAKLLTMTS